MSSQQTTMLAKRERSNRALRNRILLYLGGFEISGTASLELAAECFRRATPEPEPAEAMCILNDLLRERGLAIHEAECPSPIRSVPPVNRKTMISGQLESLTLYGSVKKLFYDVIMPELPYKKP